MSIIDRIKRLLGVAGDDTADDDAGAVTIEREPGTESSAGEPTPATETEAAVKGTDAGAAAPEPAPDATVEADTGAADTDAGANAAAEPDAGDADVDDTGDADAGDPDESASTGDDAGAGDTDPDGVPVAEIRGIGPAYSGRLAEAGVETVTELATADAERVAGATELSEKRVSTWIDRARDREST